MLIISKRFNHLYLLLMLLVLPGSTNAQVKINNVDSTSLYSYQWFLFKMPNTNLYKVDNSRIPNLLFFPGEIGHFTGSGECNNVEGQIKFADNNKIHLATLTEEAYECDHDLDRKFIAMLQEADHYKIKNDQLKLYTSGGILVGQFYADFSQECYYPWTGLEGEWSQNMLKKTKGWVDLDKLDSLPRITFTESNTETITGFTGCNFFSSRFEIEKSKIHFSEILCQEENYCDSDVEKNFQADLSSTTMFWLGSELLSFWNGNSLVMDFKRVNDIKLTKGAAWRFLKRKDKRSVFVCGN